MISENSLNGYVKHYIEKDYTKTAIMITGEWGCGKSYYIEKVLTPFLTEQGHEVLVVSLYGIEDLFALSRSIYMEARFSKLKATFEKRKIHLFKNSAEKVNAGKIVASNVAKNVAKNVFNFDIDVSDKALKGLYSSVNLSGKLLVLEDLERSNIDILKVLGFVNNLVEQDQVKVLLVANESELLNIKTPSPVDIDAIVEAMFQEQKEKKEQQSEKMIDESVVKYIEAKEKTIGDTVQFQLSQEVAISSIVELFNNSILTEIFNDGLQDYIKSIVQSICKRNLRIFIFGTQKAVDVFERIPYDKGQKDFYKCIWISAIYFSVRIRTTSDSKWSDENILSTKLGCNDYPLPRFLYDYILNQTFEPESVKEAMDTYRNYRLYENAHNNISDKDYNTLCEYYLHEDVEVRTALDNIAKKLQNVEVFPITIYGKLAYYAIVAGNIVKHDISDLEKAMKANMESFAKDIENIDDVFLRHYEIHDTDVLKQYLSLVDGLKESFYGAKKVDSFSYKPEDIDFMHDDAYKNKNKYVTNHRFISNYKIEKIAGMLLSSSAEQIHNFRGALLCIYRDVWISSFDEVDISALKLLKKLVKDGLCNAERIDNIKKKQLGWLCEDIDEILSEK
ncbi:hypothetical protein SAMN04487830_13328 [Pseudobutyrivibrio sp. OR37]|uniref:hypothetical protein n=1 Tax=Pseudobutyrivibrio sp. OR37 TaxID=1798186 RepID=UPI0008E40E36|nr:hypothetical protein [Pseudobutyrivibrio sp. OR37]SFI24422.1 hypothetical protein SAMN04487830_13328 [Pseudobutyrivibrio sp. OR37]